MSPAYPQVEVDKAVDMLVLIVPPGGGDELQGVKKGIVEVADMLIVNKADGSLLTAARHTCVDYRGAVKWQGRGKDDIREGWKVPVLLASAKENTGVDKVWEQIVKFKEVQSQNGGLEEKRRRQGKYWMWKQVQEIIRIKTESDDELREKADSLDRALIQGKVTPRLAATQLMETFFEK